MKKYIAIILAVSLIGLLLVNITSANIKRVKPKLLKPLSLIQNTNNKKVLPSSIQKKAIYHLEDKSGDEIKARFTKDTASPHLLFNEKGFLSKPSKASLKTISDNFISNNKDVLGLDIDTENSLKSMSQSSIKQGKIKKIVYNQEINGLPVFDSYLQVNTTNDGKIINISGHYATQIDSETKTSISYDKAIESAVESSKADATKLLVKPQASKVYYVSGGSAKLAWKIPVNKNAAERYIILVDASNGKVVLRANLVSSAAQGFYNYKNPDDTGWLTTSFAGWVDGSGYSLGNNVDAHADWNGYFGYPYWDDPTNTNRAQATGSDFTLGGSLEGYSFPMPGYSYFNNFYYTYGTYWWYDSYAAVVNVFYQNNNLHDFFYTLGFDEAAGNFQQDNFGLGGEGNDRVQADVQDGYQTDNAFFFTPPDGNHPGDWGDGRPRMTLHLFTPGGVGQYIDSSFDGQIIAHEYGHGVSNRLVGGPESGLGLIGSQSGAMGEGWSDYWAMTRYNSLPDNTIIGEYATKDSTKGMRHYNYSTSPLDYGDYGYDGGPEVHNDGEIWAATLWDIEQALGSAAARQLIFTGISLTPPRPTFLDGRDAILQADQVLNSGANKSTLWGIFAARGMGGAARTTDDYYDDADQRVYAAYDNPSSSDDVTPPTGRFTYPVNGGFARYNYSELYYGTRYHFIHTTVSASDNVSVSKVAFYRNNILDYVNRLSPYDDYFMNFSNGHTYTLTARIYDRILNGRTISTTFRFDNSKPKTYALRRASGRKYSRVRLYYSVSDPYTANRANVTIRVKTRSGRTVKTYRLGLVLINRTATKTIRLNLSRGTYRYYIYATDRAGNTQNNIARNYLVVK